MYGLYILSPVLYMLSIYKSFSCIYTVRILFSSWLLANYTDIKQYSLIWSFTLNSHMKKHFQHITNTTVQVMAKYYNSAG